MTEIVTESTKKEKTKNLRYKRDKDREKVKGIFRFYECPGSTLSFVFRAYKEDPVERFDLTDGQVYELPLGVARHLNKNGWYPQFEHVVGENGVQQAVPAGRGAMNLQNYRIQRKVHRFGFQSLEFVDNEDLSTAQDAGVVSVHLGS